MTDPRDPAKPRLAFELIDALPRVSISSIESRGPTGGRERLLVACPKLLQTVSNVTCATCPERAGYLQQDGHRPAVICNVARAAARPLHETTVGDLMKRDAVCVTRDAGVDALQSIFEELPRASCPVVDADDRPIGIVHKADLARTPLDALVGDFMQPLRFVLTEDMSVVEGAGYLWLDGSDDACVVDTAGAVIGVFCAHDVLRWVSQGFVPSVLKRLAS